MPIRINLLAEQQYLEEMRRRDPVKKAIWAAVGLALLMVLWIVLLWVDQMASKRQIARLQADYLAKTNEYMQATNQIRDLKDLQGRLQSLDHYTRERFLWANALDALQYTVVTNVKVVKLVSVQTYVTNLVIKKDSNVVFDLSPPRKWYQFGKGPPGTNVLPFVTNQMDAMATLPMFQTNKVELNRTASLKTNELKTQVTASITLTRPLTTVESRTLLISGKDYSPTVLQQTPAMTNAILTSPFFGRYLTLTNLAIDSTFQLETDPLNRSEGDFAIFTLKCEFPDVVRKNE